MPVKRRKYIRISTVLPVEFFITDHTGNKITPWLQGFTRDICKGGICLFVNDIWWGFGDRLNTSDTQLFLKINVPFSKDSTIPTKARVAWVNHEKQQDFNRCLAGIEFVDFSHKQARRLLHYAIFQKYFPWAISAIILALLGYAFIAFMKTDNLVRENKKLIKEYVRLVEDTSRLEGVLGKQVSSENFLQKRQAELTEQITVSEKALSQWKTKYEEVVLEQKDKNQEISVPEEGIKKLQTKIAQLEKDLGHLHKENVFLKNKQEERKLAALKVKEEVAGLMQQKEKFSAKIIQGMYSWIRNRQDLHNGLVLSYEGDGNLKNVCFTYDQALAAIVFLIFDDYPHAAKILDFYYKKVIEKEKIYNAYFSNGNIFENQMHSGPYAWIGIAALNYVKRTGEKKYLAIAEHVTRFLALMLDNEGGVRGGPADQWYSTEHNLDVYAFFMLMYQIAGEEKYLHAANRICDWIVKYAYTDQGAQIKRGKGDSTIATDTYAWSVTALGPEKLRSLNMDPEAILQFAIDNCEVKVKFLRDFGDIEVTGFDFAKIRNRARGGVVSCEWTAQMIVAFEIMANYYFEKKDTKQYEYYMHKSLFYSNELQKMLILSPSKIGKADPCLPYASSASVNTGHGWRTPAGNKTGSLASTAYFLLAYHGYNPLNAHALSIAIKGKDQDKK